MNAADIAVVGATAPGKPLPFLIRMLLAQRGLATEDGLERFLRPRLAHLSAPELLPNMEAAAARLDRAVAAGETVVLYGDYDVDGVTALAILKRVLGELGLDVRTFLPHRANEGYGLSAAGLERCLADGRPDLLVAVDCGTVSVAEVASLRARSIDVVVLDHHEPSPDSPPDAIVVNPKLGDSFHYLCSAGIAFKAAHALLKRHPFGNADRQRILDGVLDLVALGTVADVVPLTGENRLLVAKGLERLGTTRNLGLRALKAVAGVDGAPRARHLSFRLGPRLNAAGRLETAEDSLELLVTEQPARAAELAQRLDLQNRDRRTIQTQVETEAAVEALDQAAIAPAVVIGSEAWHPGVVGIVAGRLARRLHRPTFVIAFDEAGIGKGSGRSIEGVSLVEAIEACRDTLIAGGGHAMAAGITIRRDCLDPFRRRFSQAVADQTGGPGGLRRRLWADAEAFLADLDFELLDACEALEPFGDGNPLPVLLLRRVAPAQEPVVLKEKHRRLELHQAGTTVTAMWFDSVSVPLPPPPWDVLVTIERGHFRGEDRVEVYVQDLRASSAD